MGNTICRQVYCENGMISYLLTRKPVKNVNLRVKPDGRVLVSANEYVPEDVIDGFIKQKQDFILTAFGKYEEKRKSAQNIPLKYVSGENYDLLGKSLKLKVEESLEEAVYTDGEYIFLKIRDKEDFRRKEKMMEKWLNERQMQVFEELICETYQLFRKYGVPYPILRVKRMTSRWGFCQPEKGIITLNSYLIKAPRRCIEYVALHEFAHFIYPNHSRQFWDFVTELMPDWKERKKELSCNDFIEKRNGCRH